MKNELYELWKDWTRERTTEVSDARCKLRFELLEYLRRLPDDERERQLPLVAEYASVFDDVDEATFRKMLKAWMADDASEFRRTTLERLGCDPEAWKGWSKN